MLMRPEARSSSALEPNCLNRSDSLPSTTCFASLRAGTIRSGDRQMLGMRRTSHGGGNALLWPAALALGCMLVGCGDAGTAAHSGQRASGPAEPSVLPVRPSASAVAAAPYAWINGPYVVRLGKSLELDGSGSYAREGALVTYAW